MTVRPALPAVNNDRTIELPDQSGILGYVALSTTTVSSAVADITFDNLSTTFDTFVFHMNLHPATDNVGLRAQFLDSSGTAISGASDYGYTFHQNQVNVGSDNTESHMRLGHTAIGNGSHEGIRLSGTLMGRNYATGTTDSMPPAFFGQYQTFDQAATPSGGSFNASLNSVNQQTIRGIKFFFESGNIEAGSISIFGIQAN